MEKQNISELIEQNIQGLVGRWMSAVRADEHILSDADLSEIGLKDHVPEILAEICEFLRCAETPGVHNAREAHVSAYTRYLQGYRGRDLARELSHLRILLLDFLGEKLLASPALIDLREFLAATRTIHLYIDEELRYAFPIFTEPLDASSMRKLSPHFEQR